MPNARLIAGRKTTARALWHDARPFALLNLLWVEDGLSGADLGVRLQLDSTTITGVLDRLAHLGLIERRPDPTDRRINRVQLTAQGSALRVPLSRVIEQFNAQFFGMFSPADARRLQTMLARLGHVEQVAA